MTRLIFSPIAIVMFLSFFLLSTYPVPRPLPSVSLGSPLLFRLEWTAVITGLVLVAGWIAFYLGRWRREARGLGGPPNERSRRK